VPERAVPLATAGVNPAWLDKGADACQDFYQVACGGLVKNVEIPADQARWGPAQELQLHTEELLRAMLEKDVKEPGDDPVRKKLGAWFGACMDEPAIEKAGAGPLKPLFAIVDKVKDEKTVDAAVIELHRRGIFPAFSVGSQQDFKDASLVIAGLDQDGLGLPDRDY
jgi:predicted metalloendopeptidase